MRTILLIGCFLIGLSQFCVASDDPATGQLIGLCYKDGSNDLVLEEMLRDEGIPYARIRDLDELNKSGLKGLIIGEGFDGSADEVKRFVEKGGVLLTLKPDGRLAELIGLKNVGVQKNGSMTVGGHAATMISYEGRLQLFGEVNQYHGGENLAALSEDSKFGGIVRVKRDKGTVLAVAFDLPTTMLTIMQPKSEEIGAASDASNVEYELGEVPQIDLLRRLLVGTFLESLDVPIPRKWYFPSQNMAMLIPSGDQDWAGFEQMKATMELMQEVGSPYTIYLTASSQPITSEQFKVFAAGGIEFALHPDFMGGQPFNEDELAAQLKQVVSDVGGPIFGQRPHCCRWETCAHLPAWSEKVGLQYESILGLKYWDDKPVKLGYWVGTGLPYHVIDEQNHRRLDFLEIPIYGCDNLDFWKPDGTTLVYKEGGKPLKLVGQGLNEEESFQLSKRMIDLAVEKYHTVYSYIWHPHYLAAKKLNQDINTTDTHFRKTVDYAKSCGMGLISTNAMNEFWRSREMVSMNDLVWNPQTSSMRCKLGGTKIKDLTLIVPLQFGDKKATVLLDSNPQDYKTVDLFGSKYAMWTIDLDTEPAEIEIQYK